MSALITKREKQKRGFTMIELLAVLVILGVIMVIAIPSVVSYLQGARTDYYEQLEESVRTTGQEYFSDHRSLLPRENGQIFSVDIQDLVAEGYTTEILDSDGNNTCTGTVYVKRLATADFEYHACIKCGKKDSEGNQEYVSTGAFCTGGSSVGDGTCDKPKDNPTDDCFMIKIPNSFKVPQCTTVEDSAAAQGITLEGIVLNNGEDIGDRVTADTTNVDYRKIGNYFVYYTYKQVLNPAGEKYNFGVSVYDDKAPSEPTITMHTDSATGDVYNCTSADNCNWTGKDLYITFTATDESGCGTEGSGVEQFMYRYGSSGNWQTVNATKQKDNNIYTATITRNRTYDGYIEVKATDGAQTSGASSNHESGVTKAYLKIDKTAPSCTSSGGSSNWINASSNPGTITITGTCSDAQAGCREEKITKEYTTDINSTTESPGTVYDNAGNSTVCPGNRTVKIDKTAPTCTSTANRGTVTGTCQDSGSGCKQSTITQVFQTNGTFSPGNVVDNAGNSTACPAIQVVVITTPIGKTWEFGYTGSYQTFTAPDDGNYKLEVWGAQGGGDTHTQPGIGTVGYSGGNGGYIAGQVWLTKGATLTVGVGGQATDFNGGTNPTSLSPGTTCAGGGGGATDMRYNGVRIIVAGGGGGTAGCDGDAGNNCQPVIGGAGGAAGSGNLGNTGSGAGEQGKLNTGNGLWGSYPCGAGGGGGYAGGAGGNGYLSAAVGGSSFFDTNYGTYLSEQAGVREGSGYAKITYQGL